jgi:hypothetical protein
LRRDTASMTRDVAAQMRDLRVAGLVRPALGERHDVVERCRKGVGVFAAAIDLAVTDTASPSIPISDVIAVHVRDEPGGETFRTTVLPDLPLRSFSQPLSAEFGCVSSPVCGVFDLHGRSVTSPVLCLLSEDAGAISHIVGATAGATAGLQSIPVLSIRTEAEVLKGTGNSALATYLHASLIIAEDQ